MPGTKNGACDYCGSEMRSHCKLWKCSWLQCVNKDCGALYWPEKQRWAPPLTSNPLD